MSDVASGWHAYDDGSAVTGLAAFTRTEGSTGIAADVAFAFEAYAVAASPMPDAIAPWMHHHGEMVH